MKTDARTRYTQMQIKKSFLTLMRERPMSKITVKSICELAEINRATFYKYYADPYDLLDKLQLEMAGHVKDLLENLSEAAKTDAVVETSVRRSSNSTTDTSLVINPAVIPYWFVDEARPQRVGSLY